ncbi:MAG TPA: glycosyltransferase family A protein [Candidatus Methylacidiphilales bacterium]
MVSVIIPNYNREALIGETIANLIGQTAPPDEIIVVDDGSTDQSVKVIQSFGAKVKLLRQANQGPGAARNAGLRMASGDFIQFQDSDDLFSLNKLEAQAKLLDQSGADIAFGPWVKVKLEAGRAVFENQVLQQKMPPARLPLACWWLRGWSTVFQSLLFRRSFLDKIGFYRTDLMLGEDGELFFRALTCSPTVAFCGEALTLYRLHEINKLTQNEGTSHSRRIIDWAKCLQYMMRQCESSGLSMDLMTRSIFLSGVRKHLAYLRSSSGASPELVESLAEPVAKMSGLWLSAVDLWTRGSEQASLRWRGSRWMTAYQPSKPTAGQLKLIGDLGFAANYN